MKTNINIALSDDEDSNVIFLHLPHDQDESNPHPPTDSEKFSELPHGTPKDKEEEEEENNIKDEPTLAEDINTLSIGQLKNRYRGEWNSFNCMRYVRCGPKGNYVCHPNLNTFPKFLLALGRKPGPSYTLDRRDSNNPEYSRENCRWASKPLQTQNRKNTRYLTDSAGNRHCMAEWSRRSGVPLKTLHNRIDKLGWSNDDAVQTAVGQRRKSFAAPLASASGSSSASDVPTKPRASPVAEYIPDHIRPLIEIWKEALKERHDAPFFVVETKHLRLLKDIEHVLVSGGVDAEKVLRCVANDWGSKWEGFVSYSMDSGGYKPPHKPTLEYLRANINAAGNFYLKAGGKYEGFGWIPADELADIHIAEQTFYQINDSEL